MKGLRFTGGDIFTGLLKLYHEVMMRNELRNGYGAYEVNWAGGKSGFSFGGNQMDIGWNKEKAGLFVDILRQARDKRGEFFFTQSEIEAMVGTKNEKLFQRGQPLKTVFGDHLAIVNAALSSDYGQRKINEEYVKEMHMRAKHIDIAVDSLKNPAAKTFYETALGKVLLFDYHNQLHLDLKGPFIAHYIDGTFNDKQRIAYGTGARITAPTDYYAMNEHQAFLDSTKHCFERAKDCIRRLDNIKKVFIEFSDLISSLAKDLVSSSVLAEHDVISFAWPLPEGEKRGMEALFVPDYQPSLWERLSAYFPVSLPYEER